MVEKMRFLGYSDAVRVAMVDDMVTGLIANKREYMEMAIEFFNADGINAFALAELLNFIYSESIFSDEELADLLEQEWDIDHIVFVVLGLA